MFISLSKDTRKDFHVIIAFGHSTFIASQLLFVAMNMVLKRYLACRTFRKCKPYSNEELFIHTYILFTCKIDADNQLHNCVCGALFVKMMVLQIQTNPVNRIANLPSFYVFNRNMRLSV